MVPRNFKKFPKSSKNSQKLLKNPRRYQQFAEGYRDSQKVLENSRDSQMVLEGSRDSQKVQEISRCLEHFQPDISIRFRKFSKPLKVLRRLQRFPESSRKFQRFPEGSRNFQKPRTFPTRHFHKVQEIFKSHKKFSEGYRDLKIPGSFSRFPEGSRHFHKV